MESSTDRSSPFNGYEEAVVRLLNSQEIREWKLSRALEAAKVISINTNFQNAIQNLRDKYRIEHGIGKEDSLPDVVLQEYTAHLDAQEREQLLKDLPELAKNFDLDWEMEDEGLIVAALCYGVTPESILANWKTMEILIARTRTPGVQLVINSQAKLEKVYYMVIISHLCTQLR